jgi:hypothetical protein
VNDAPFRYEDLVELDVRLLSRADRVVSMRDIANGDIGRGVIALRHDVDDNAGSLDTALAMAEWECRRGYRSTYFLLHDSHYWEDVGPAAQQIEYFGHEVGIHVNAIAEGLRQNRNPTHVLRDALDDLLPYAKVTGCVAHGDNLCHIARFVNDEMFVESPRPDWGLPERLIVHNGYQVQLRPVSRSDFGLRYDANWLPRGHYVSDSGGHWSEPFDELVRGWGSRGQLHVLQHPDWWARAFTQVVA